jgi:hypothetical protein
LPVAFCGRSGPQSPFPLYFPVIQRNSGGTDIDLVGAAGLEPATR